MIEAESNVTNFDKYDIFLNSTIEEFLLEKKKRSDNTYKSYKNGLDIMSRDLFGCEYKFLKKSHLESLTVDALIKYFNELFIAEDDEYGERVYSNSTINLRQTIMKQTLKYLSARKKIKLNFNVLELDVLIKTLPNDADITEALSREDAFKYISHFRSIEGLPLYLLGKLAVNTGLRISNLLKLEWNQFALDGENDVMIYSKKNKSKGNKEWENSISYEFYKELEQLRNGEDERLFKLKYRNVARLFNETKEHFNHGDKNYSFHSFRKTCLTYVYECTGDIFASQQKGNHKSILTTQRYIKKKKYGAIEMFSSKEKLDNEIYKKISHEELLECISELNKNTLYLINMKIMERLDVNG